MNGDFSNLSMLDISTVIILALVGVINFAIGRTFQNLSVGFVGAPRTDAPASTSVIYAPPLAIIFLSQPFMMKIVLGVLFLALGSSFILPSTVSSENKDQNQGSPLKGIGAGLA